MQALKHRLPKLCRSFRADLRVSHWRLKLYPLLPTHRYLHESRYNNDTNILYEDDFIQRENEEFDSFERLEKQPLTAFDCLHLSAYLSSENLSINTFDELLYESDVADNECSNQRLVDHSLYSHNYELWAHLLEFRVRLFGLNGAWTIWKGLRSRNIDLPTDGDKAAIFWDLFVKASFKHGALPDLFHYALGLYQRENRYFEQLYDYIICLYLESGPTRTYAWHQTLGKLNLPAPNTLPRLVDAAVRSNTSLESFQKLYENSKDQRIHDHIIAALCERGKIKQAIFWHDLLKKYNDYPVDAKVTEPLRRRFKVSQSDDLSEKTPAHITEHHEPFDTLETRGYQAATKLSRENMSRMLGEAHDIRPIKITDQFCARLFATQFFSTDFCMRGLASLGARTIGPLALRELGMRCSQPEELIAEIRKLKDCNLVLEDCTFTKLVVKLAQESRKEALSSLLRSDQHPDVLDDTNTQMRLLLSYIRAGDWVQVQRTILVLTLTSSEPLTEAWNILLRAQIDLDSKSNIDQIIRDMLHYGVVVRGKTLSHFLYSASQRVDGLDGEAAKFEIRPGDLLFVTNMWLRILRAGGEVPGQAWNLILNSFTHKNRDRDLHGLLYLLAVLYSRKILPVVNSAAEATGKRQYTVASSNLHSTQLAHYRHARSQVFTAARIQSLVAFTLNNKGWDKLQSQQGSEYLTDTDLDDIVASECDGLADSPKMSLMDQKWARGLSLLAQLRDCGIKIPSKVLRTACIGVIRSILKQGVNDVQNNGRYSIVDVIDSMNEIWGKSTIFPNVIRETILTRICTAQKEKRENGL